MSSPPENQKQDRDTLTVYSSRSEICNPGKLVRDIVESFFAGREIAWRLFLRNLRGMYRQTLLGLFWAFLPPIANTAMWIFLKNQVGGDFGPSGIDYTPYVLTGMILWQAFLDAFQMPMNKLRSNKNMLSKINFPRESLLLVGVGEVMFNLAIRLLLLVPTYVYYQVPFHSSMLLAPLTILGLVLVGLGMGLLLTPVGSLYQDVGRFLTMILPFWMILTPIIYSPATEGPATLLNWLNPASPLLILSRDLLLFGGSTHIGLGVGFALGALFLTLVGLVIYRISLPVLIERMQA